MDTFTTLLCTLFALVKQRRVTAENLRRFVECPERLNDDWTTATAEEHLAQIAWVKVGQEFADLRVEDLRAMLGDLESARTPGEERLNLFLAEEAFRIGVEEGISVIQMRWFDGKKVESWEHKEDVERIRVSEEWRHNYAELRAIVQRAISGAQVSPYELVIQFGNCISYSGHLLLHAGGIQFKLEERIKRENLTLSKMSDEELRALAKSYWQPYREHAREIVAGLDKE